MNSNRASIIALAVLCGSAEAQIYRCKHDQSTVFSDRPCGVESQAYKPSANVSYITPDDSLPALAESARRFIAQRQERLARSAGRSSTMHTAEPDRNNGQPDWHQPWRYPIHRPAAAHHRAPPGSPGRAPDTRRYSALNGPILGTRDRAPYRVRQAGDAAQDDDR